MVDPDDEPSNRVAQIRLQFTDEIDREASIVLSDLDFVEWLRERFGDELRVVSAYNDRTHEILHLRPEIREEYTQQEFTATGDEFLLSSQREDPYQERLFHLGSFKYDVKGFEDGQIVRIPLDEKKGVLVSFDSTTELSLPGFVDQLKRDYAIVIE